MEFGDRETVCKPQVLGKAWFPLVRWTGTQEMAAPKMKIQEFGVRYWVNACFSALHKQIDYRKYTKTERKDSKEKNKNRCPSSNDS